jgi:hypothetical protein
MKFIVFNIVVLLSLGYLFTAQEGQTVGNWLDAIPGKITESYETRDVTPLLSKGQGFYRSKGDYASGKMPNSREIQVINAQPQDKNILVDDLKLLIEKTVNESFLRQISELETTTNGKVSSSELAESVNNSQDPVQENFVSSVAEQKTELESDEELALAFAEFSHPKEDTESGESMLENLGGLNANGEPEQQGPAFMSTYERRLALSDFIQQVQILSVERGGF